MELEIQNDVFEYISTQTPFYKVMMCEYFLRLKNFSGVDEFGNATDEVPINSLIGPTFNYNTLVQAVNMAAALYRDFPGLSNANQDSLQQFTTGKPCIKDEILHNAYSLPVRELLELFNNSLEEEKNENVRPILHIGKNLQFYFEGRSHDVLYRPLTGGLPKKIIQLLYANYHMEPLTSGAIIKSIISKKKLFSQDITASISDINDAFKKSSALNVPVIINKAGYFFNDRYFEIVFD